VLFLLFFFHDAGKTETKANKKPISRLAKNTIYQEELQAKCAIGSNGGKCRRIFES